MNGKIARYICRDSDSTTNIYRLNLANYYRLEAMHAGQDAGNVSSSFERVYGKKEMSEVTAQ